jgi:hypothetical protein
VGGRTDQRRSSERVDSYSTRHRSNSHNYLAAESRIQPVLAIPVFKSDFGFEYFDIR